MCVRQPSPVAAKAEETIIAAAMRGLTEQAGLSGTRRMRLDSTWMLPKTVFLGHELWTEHPYVIPEYAFGVQDVRQPRLAEEHSKLRWCDYAEADNLLRFDSNKIALWELNLRINT